MASTGVSRILVVEDHPVARRGIVSVLEQEPDLTVCAEADDVASALSAVEANEVDIVLVDIGLGQSSGLELVRELKASSPDLPTLVLSMHNEAFYAERSLRTGAMGYITKSESGKVIVHAIREVLAGRVYVSQSLAGQILSDLIGGNASSPISQLTSREFEIFELLGRGLQTREIAEKLGISLGTVDAHREHMKKKLSIPSAQKLLVYAVQWTQASSRV